MITQAITDKPLEEDPKALARWINRELLPLLRQIRANLNGGGLSATPAGPAGGQLDGTYPDPSVVGLTETSGPTALDVGAIADGEFLRRDGTDIVGDTPSTAPTGAAGGQLGGTYPNPIVTGATETSGPTALDWGDVADGEFVRRDGTELVGDTPATGSTPVSLPGFRCEDQGGAFSQGVTRVHPVGVNSAAGTSGWFNPATTNTLQSIGAGQMAYVYAERFERAVTINRLAFRTNGAVSTAGSPRAKIGVYAAGSLASGVLTGSPYPGARLAQSGDFAMTAANQTHESIVSLSVAAGTYLWFAIVFNDQAVTDQFTVAAYRAGVLFPIVGFTWSTSAPSTISNDNATAGVGWRHAVTYGTTDDLPDPFPQSAPAILTGTADIVLPVPFFGFTLP